MASTPGAGGAKQWFNVDGSFAKPTNWTPKPPSSLIKVSRWGLLFAGIIYGYRRRKYLTEKETDPEHRSEQQFLHDIRRYKEKMAHKKKSYEELNGLASTFDVKPLPPWKDEMYYETDEWLYAQPRVES